MQNESFNKEEKGCDPINEEKELRTSILITKSILSLIGKLIGSKGM